MADPKAAGADQGRTLLALARQAIAARLRGEPFALGAHPNPDEEWLLTPAATFVTLTRDGALRGCIGSLEAVRPLREDVVRNAVSAAFGDPRFRPLGPDEFDDLVVEVSLLSARRPVAHSDETSAIHHLRPGIDGVVIRYGTANRATFLPQVWDEIPEPSEFLRHLKRKAGLPGDWWSPDLEVETYTVSAWVETDLGGPDLGGSDLGGSDPGGPDGLDNPHNPDDRG